MKCEFREHEGCFEIEMEPESSQEIVLLARFGMNKTKEIRSQFVSFCSDGTVNASVVIGKKRNANNSL